MSAQVHRLTAAGPVIEPEQGVIEMFRELLARAERGEIRAAAACYADGGDGVNTWIEPGCAPAALMVAAATRLQYRVMQMDGP